MSTTFTILGSGAGDATAMRSCAGYVLSFNGKLFLFDCGSGVTSAFLLSGFDPSDVEAIFISHMHADHVCDLPLFIQKLHLLKRRKPLQIYMPTGGIRPLNYFLNACYLFKEKLSFPVEPEPMKPIYEFFGGKLAVYAIANRHLFGNADIVRSLGLDNRMQCFSFRINADGRIIFYSADVQSLDDIEKYLDGVNLLIVETTHIDFKKLPVLVRKNKIENVILTHIADDMLVDIQGFIKAFPGNYILAEDNMTIDI